MNFDQSTKYLIIIIRTGSSSLKFVSYLKGDRSNGITLVNKRSNEVFKRKDSTV